MEHLKFGGRLGLSTFITLLVCLLYLFITLNKLDGNPAGFVTYDGHYSYQIAYRLFNDESAIPPSYKYRETVPQAYRIQRIVYPFIARVLAFNHPEWIPWTLILVNLFAIVAGTWGTELILKAYQISPWYALAYGLYGGQLIALRADMNEPLAQAFVQFAILFSIKKQYGVTAILFAIALLTKETAVLFIGGFIVAEFLRKNWTVVMQLLFSILPYIAFQIFLFYRIGEFGFSAGMPFLPPLWGWLMVSQMNLAAFMLISLTIVPIGIIPLIAGFTIATQSLWKRHFHPFVFSIIFHCLFILFLPHLTFREGSALIRVVQGLAVSILLYGAVTRSRRMLNYSLLWLFSNVLILNGAG